jgi:hypothetical protein
MNDNLYDIVKKAGFVTIGDAVYSERWYKSKCGFTVEELERFAALIIVECAGKAVDFGCDKHTDTQIIEHFGVTSVTT